MLGAEQRLGIRRLADRCTGITLRHGLDDMLCQPDHEDRAWRFIDRPSRQHLAPAMGPEPPHDDEVGIELPGESRDLVGDVTDTDVERHPPSLPGALDPFEYLGREALSGSFGLALSAHRQEMQVGSVMPRCLIERMLEDDLGILGEVERDDHAVRATDVHDHARSKSRSAATVARILLGTLARSSL